MTTLLNPIREDKPRKRKRNRNKNRDGEEN